MRRLWPYLVAVPVVAVVVAYGVISFRVAETVTQVERVPLDPPASSIAATHEDVTFNSRDGIVLKGWWFEVASADRAVVIVHGRGRNRVNSDFMEAAIARLLLVHGYSVLLFDLRGHGESGGTRYTLGIEEPRDVLAAIDLAASKADIDTTVPLDHGYDLKAASRNPRTELWIVPGCEHVKAFATHPDEWAQHVLSFLSRELDTQKPVTAPAGIVATSQRGG